MCSYCFVIASTLAHASECYRHEHAELIMIYIVEYFSLIAATRYDTAPNAATSKYVKQSVRPEEWFGVMHWEPDGFANTISKF